MLSTNHLQTSKFFSKSQPHPPKKKQKKNKQKKTKYKKKTQKDNKTTTTKKLKQKQTNKHKKNNNEGTCQGRQQKIAPLIVVQPHMTQVSVRIVPMALSANTTGHNGRNETVLGSHCLEYLQDSMSG